MTLPGDAPTLDCVHCGQALVVPSAPADGDTVECWLCGGTCVLSCDVETEAYFAHCEAVDCQACTEGFRINPDGSAVFIQGCREFPMRPVTARPRKYLLRCALCRQPILSGDLAYEEVGPAAQRRWLSGVKVCAKCVGGALKATLAKLLGGGQ